MFLQSERLRVMTETEQHLSLLFSSIFGEV
uniref:Uncharacterized protein n=1 Tax=Anguilla anguilla TaxID=7936 RepID=A0A0E9P7B2_ANGAN